jgi:hypothetical protein
MAARRAAEEGVQLVTFGHTHDASVEDLPEDGVYINSGTWTWRADFGGSGKETWKELFTHPERFTEDRNLTYVRFDYDQGGHPSGRLLRYEPGGRGLDPGEVDGPPSIWHRIEDWLRRLAEFFGIDV